MLNLKRANSWSKNSTQQDLTSQIDDLEVRKRISVQLTRQSQQNNMTLKNQTAVLINQILRNSINLSACQICMRNVSIDETHSIGHCEHKFCEDCLAQYCILKIKTNQDVICPQGGCREKLDQNLNIYEQLPEEIKEKYKQHIIWKQSLENPNIKLCPSQTCKGGEIDLLKIPPECRKCQTKYCKQCMMKYHEGPCDQNFQKQFKQWKRCPKCKIFIQKNEGCNHMTCRCTHQFCFVCLADWEASHYQCTVGFNGLFFTGTEQISKIRALLYLIGLILLLPFVLVSIVLVLALAIALGAISGVCLATCAFVNCIKDFRLLGQICCLAFLPIVLALGLIVAPPACICCLTIPISRKIIRKYKNTLTFVLEQLTKTENKSNQVRRVMSEQQINQQIQLK